MSLSIIASSLGDVAAVLNIANELTALVRRGIEAQSQITAIAAKATAEGRKTLTPEEWAVVLGEATAARNDLAAKLGVA